MEFSYYLFLYIAFKEFDVKYHVKTLSNNSTETLTITIYDIAYTQTVNTFPHSSDYC